MSSHKSIFSSLAGTFRNPPRSFPSSSSKAGLFFSTTRVVLAKKNAGPKKDRRVTLIRYCLHHPITLVPRPLRFSRLRALRHWTIHRAYQMHKDNLRSAENLELERQYASMWRACEELRLGVGDGGKLYHQAMTKRGVWGGRSDLDRGIEKGREAGIPLEYARSQTDGPPRNGFDEAWKR